MIQSMPAVVHFTPGQLQVLTLTSELLIHQPLENVREPTCFRVRGGGTYNDAQRHYLNSNRVVTRTITESGDMHMSITLTIIVSGEHDEGLYICKFSKSLAQVITSTLVLMDTSTTYLPPNYDFISIYMDLRTEGDAPVIEGKANAIHCMRVSTIPGLPTLSLNGEPILLGPQDMMVVSRENYTEQYVRYYIDSVGPESSGTYTCGSENGSATQSVSLISAT